MSNKLYNVAVPVVDLITAESEREAIRELQARLRAAGFDPYEGPLPVGAHAFESEGQEHATDPA